MFDWNIFVTYHCTFHTALSRERKSCVISVGLIENYNAQPGIGTVTKNYLFNGNAAAFDSFTHALSLII